MLKIHNIIKLAASLLLTVVLASCNAVYEDEGDCTIYDNYLAFVYDMNLKWADAFPAEVTSVRVYAFDTDGQLVWQETRQGAELASGNFRIPLDLVAGKYHIVAWCGVDNGVEPEKESFEVTSQVTDLNSLNCRLNRVRHDEYGPSSASPLFFLYHGAIDIEIPGDNELGRTFTVPLTKNTNNVRIVLQHISGETLSADDFIFRIEDTNGHLHHDNSLLPDEKITYLPYQTFSGSAVVGKDEDDASSRALVAVTGAIADLHLNRLMEGHRKETKLIIDNKKTSERIAEIPLIDYALLAKDYYEQLYGHRMTDQEFLDREDNYVMTLFLDKNLHWLDSSILIHSWRVVHDDADLN